MEINIDKDVPIPSKGRTKYPLGEMNVGDSFLVNKGAEKTSSLRMTVSIYGKKHNKKFTTRTTPDGVRVWRIE